MIYSVGGRAIGQIVFIFRAATAMGLNGHSDILSASLHGGRLTISPYLRTIHNQFLNRAIRGLMFFITVPRIQTTSRQRRGRS